MTMGIALENNATCYQSLSWLKLDSCAAIRGGRPEMADLRNPALREQALESLRILTELVARFWKGEFFYVIGTFDSPFHGQFLASGRRVADGFLDDSRYGAIQIESKDVLFEMWRTHVLVEFGYIVSPEAFSKERLDIELSRLEKMSLRRYEGFLLPPSKIVSNDSYRMFDSCDRVWLYINRVNKKAPEPQSVVTAALEEFGLNSD